MSDFIIIIFLFPIFFMIHEFEEIIMIQKWINHNQIKLTQRFPHLYPIIKKASKIDTHKFSIIVAEEFIIVSTCCTISIYTGVRGNLAVSNFRKMSLPTYEIQIKDYGYRKFNKKIHIMEQNL